MAVEQRQSVFFRSKLQSLQSADYYFDHPGSIIQQSEAGTKAIVQSQHLLPDEAAMLKDFTDLLKIDPSNFGVVSYDQDGKTTFYTEPVIGLDSRNVPGLMVGADTTLNGQKLASVFVPLIQNQAGEYKLGDSVSKVALSLIGNSDPSIPKVPYLVVKSKKFVYHIGLRKPKDTAAELLDSAFDDSLEQFAAHLSKFSAEFCAFGKMFSNAFETGTFPEKGVLLVLRNGIKKVTQQQSKPEMISSMWKLAAFPEEMAGFPVRTLNDELVELSEVGMIFCPSSSDMTKKVVLLDKKIDVMYVLIRGRHKSSVEWCPDHVAFELPERLSMSTQKAFAVTIVNAQKTLAPAASSSASEQTIDVPSVESNDKF
jgi:hypothetical protein